MDREYIFVKVEVKDNIFTKTPAECRDIILVNIEETAVSRKIFFSGQWKKIKSACNI